MSSSATGVGMPICFLWAILLILTQKSSQKFGDVLGIFYLLVSLKEMFFRKPTRPSLLLKKESFLPLRLSCKESSTFSPSPSSSGSGDVTALRCSEPLRYKVGGASKPSPCFAGWDRLNHSHIEQSMNSILFCICNCVNL